MKRKRISVFKSEIKWIVSVWILVTGVGSINAQNMNIGPAVMSYPYSELIFTGDSNDWAAKISQVNFRTSYHYCGPDTSDTMFHYQPGYHFTGYSIQWGDGETTERMGLDTIYNNKEFFHTYLNPGTYTIKRLIYFMDSTFTKTTTYFNCMHPQLSITYLPTTQAAHTYTEWTKNVPSNPSQFVSNTYSRLNDNQTRLWFDCLLCPLKYSSTQIRFLFNNGTVLDQYLGDPTKPFTTWDSNNSKKWKDVWYNWYVFEWNPLIFPFLFPNTVMNPIYKYAAPYIEAIYKDSATGGLLGIVHLELRTTLETNPVPPILYSIGIAYSTNNGNNWTYCGNVITPQAQKPDGSTSAIYYHIGGGAYIIKKNPINGDSIYVYYTDYATRTPADAIGRLCLASAKLSQVIDSAKHNTVCTWVKYNKDSSQVQQGLTGLGSPILPIENFAFNSHNKAVYCKAIKKYLLVVGAWDNYLGADTGWALRMYSSNDGITWPKFWRIDNAYYTQTSPIGDIGGYASFSALPNDPDAADDFHEVGRVFYINYPKSPIYTRSLSYGDLYYKKIIATPDISPAINLLLGD
jgi:hypothetical protein